MAGTLLPAVWFQALDDTGVAVAGALLNFYASGTSTRLTAYADGGLTIPLSNPAQCDSAGRLVVYLQPTAYKFIATTPLGAQLGLTVDPVVPSGSAGTGLVGASLGEVFFFGGDASSPVTLAAYPTGATFDKLHAGSTVLNLDSATLAPGTYVLEVNGVVASAATLTVGLMNLTDGNPDTALVEATITSLTGARAQSAAITFAAGGTAKDYGIKSRISAASGEAWGVQLRRTA